MEGTATASTDLSFKHAYRLQNAGAFRRVFQKARRSQDRYFTVLHRDNDAGEARLGFAVAKKVLSRAVRRNRVRRICRESFRHQREHLPALDIIILARSGAKTASNSEMFASLDTHWARLASTVPHG